ncbi:anaerobic ribonucleoside-triphosphate reductase activating protein [Aquabacterium sp.]|uniref:anaerobic ribonucleoside-triphosphate reductase activating protein n=1 Tax=Aquabacterium sp. TaxID=1872578 RepID=UPI0035B35EDC
MAARLTVGGFSPLSTTDWPDALAAVVFVQGCPWRCHYCHNIGLQPRDAASATEWPQVLQTLERRQGLLDGVVFSGGEPTLDPALPDAMREVRALGFKVGLHTAGIYPDRLAEVLPLVDWVGFDLKTTFDDYDSVTAVQRSSQPAWRSFQAVLQAAREDGLDFEIRTTYHPRLHSDNHLLSLAAMLTDAGVSRWVLQNFRPAHDEHADLASDWHAPPPTLLQQLRDSGVELTLR